MRSYRFEGDKLLELDARKDCDIALDIIYDGVYTTISFANEDWQEFDRSLPYPPNEAGETLEERKVLIAAKDWNAIVGAKDSNAASIKTAIEKAVVLDAATLEVASVAEAIEK